MLLATPGILFGFTITSSPWWMAYQAGRRHGRAAREGATHLESLAHLIRSGPLLIYLVGFGGLVPRR